MAGYSQLRAQSRKQLFYKQKDLAFGYNKRLTWFQNDPGLPMLSYLNT